MPRGVPKSGHRKPLTKEHLGKLQAGRARARKQQLRISASLAGGPSRRIGERDGSGVECSPAVWLSAHTYVGDCQYVDGDLDEVYLRALDERVVYAGACDCHHEPPFQDITIALIAAAEREGLKYDRKKKRDAEGRAKSRGLLYPPVATGALKPFKVKKPKKAVPRRSKGKPLIAVVEEMFSERKVRRCTK